MGWVAETLNAKLDKEVSALPADMRANLVRIAELIEEFGLDRVQGPHLKHLQGRLRRCG
jgi:hypothetical protein